MMSDVIRRQDLVEADLLLFDVRPHGRSIGWLQLA